MLQFFYFLFFLQYVHMLACLLKVFVRNVCVQMLCVSVHVHWNIYSLFIYIYIFTWIKESYN